MSRDREPELPAGTTVFPASDTRPDGFPADVPFVPGVECCLAEKHRDQGIVVCTWLVADPDAEARRNEWKERIDDLTGRTLDHPVLGRFVESSRDRVPQRPGSREETARAAEETRAEMQRLLDGARPGEKEELFRLAEAYREAMAAGAAGEQGVAEVSRALLESSLEDGWEVVEESELPMFTGARIVKMRKPGLTRAISAMPSAAGSSVALMQRPEETPAP